MGFFTRMAGKAAGGLLTATLGGGGRRILTGAIAGGIYGGATSQNNSSTGIFNDVLAGAAAGAGIGALTTNTAARMASGAIRLPHTLRAASAARAMGAGPLEALGFGRYAARNSSMLSNLNQAARGTFNVGWSAAHLGARTGFGVASFALKHPGTTAGLVGAGLGLASLANSGPGSSNMSNDEMMAISMAHGYPSTGFDLGMGSARRQNARAMFIDSTNGLVQGMHLGRHR